MGHLSAPVLLSLGLYTISVPLTYVYESKSEIDQLINNLDGGFIRLSMSPNFDTYREYK